jgi:protein-S-isoprenylcysteine O-methyltransferase Ste14
MINQPRIYRHSPVQFILAMVLLVVLGFLILRQFPPDSHISLILLALFVGTAFTATLYSMTQTTIISDDGISTRTLLGEKSLRWGEISRVSGGGQNIKLHNFDGGVTVSPSSQLPGYEEVVEWIGGKRPDLFPAREKEEMKRGWQSLTVLVMALVFAFSVFSAAENLAFLKGETKTAALTPLLVVIFIALVFLGMTLSLPQSLTLKGNSLRVKYFFREETLRAGEIASISLNCSRDKNVKNYSILITRKNKKSIEISGLRPSLPIIYLTLKNWRRKTAGLGPTN